MSQHYVCRGKQIELAMQIHLDLLFIQMKGDDSGIKFHRLFITPHFKTVKFFHSSIHTVNKNKKSVTD